jgi:hypothetical protein
VKLCFLIPASPTDGFCGQIAMWRRALDDLGGIYQQARVVAVFGDSAGTAIPRRWFPHFARITVHHITPAAFEANGYHAQADARWELVPEDCDLALFADADVMILRPIDELLARVELEQAIAGAIAHLPFPVGPETDPERAWSELAHALLGGDIPFEHEHTLVRSSESASTRRCPFYVNFGLVVVPRSLVDPIGKQFRALRPLVAPRLRSPDFAGQVALTLAVHSQDVPRLAMELRYNFPNDQRAEVLHADDAADLRVIHYLRTDRFDRQRIFGSADAFDAFLGLPLEGSEAVFQARVHTLTDGVYPF